MSSDLWHRIEDLRQAALRTPSVDGRQSPSLDRMVRGAPVEGLHPRGFVEIVATRKPAGHWAACWAAHCFLVRILSLRSAEDIEIVPPAAWSAHQTRICQALTAALLGAVGQGGATKRRLCPDGVIVTRPLTEREAQRVLAVLEAH